MKKHCIAVLALTVLLTGAAALRADDKKETLYPLKVGNKWDYKAGEKKITVKVAKFDKVGDQDCALLETVVDGQVVGTEHVAVTDGGVSRYTIAIPPTSQAKIEPPLLFLKLPPKKGTSWKVESRADKQKMAGTFSIGEEEITVPAGKYKTISASSPDFGTEGQKIAITSYFAPGVGMVKQVLKFNGVESVLELEKFEEGK